MDLSISWITFEMQNVCQGIHLDENIDRRIYIIMTNFA